MPNVVASQSPPFDPSADTVESVMAALQRDLIAKIEQTGRVPQDGTVNVVMGDADLATGQRVVRAEWIAREVRFAAVEEMPNYLDYDRGAGWPDALRRAALRAEERVIEHVEAAGLDPADGTPHVQVDDSTGMFLATWVPRAAEDDTTTPTTKETPTHG